jgi:hypothetical protein
MAEEKTNGAGEPVVKPSIRDWRLKQEEGALFARAEDVPNWRLADKTRRMLADLSFYFSERLPSLSGVSPQKIEPRISRQAAVIGASGIAVRSVGSGMAMISCGYLPEAAGPVRRLVEAKLNAQAVLEDSTGEYAARYLQGRPRGITKLAQKYGAAEDVKLLSMLTHADVRGLSLLDIEPPRLSSDGVQESTFSVLPDRNEQQAQELLYAIAYECGSMCACLAEAFGVGVEMPAWVSRELLRIRDEREKRHETEGATQTSGSSRPGSRQSLRGSGTTKTGRVPRQGG